MLFSPFIIELNPVIFIIQPTNVCLNDDICSIANVSFKAVYATTWDFTFSWSLSTYPFPTMGSPVLVCYRQKVSSLSSVDT